MREQWNTATNIRLVREWVDGRKLRLHRETGRNVQDPIGHEDSSAASVEDAKFESSRGVIIDPAVDAGAGATWRRIDGAAGG
jgi:hypothetical protein